MKKISVMAVILLMISGIFLWRISVWEKKDALSPVDHIAEELQQESRPVVRVGFPIQEGLTEVDEYGNHFGYTVDYLNEINKYTNWQYEFVQVEGGINEQLTVLLDMLKNGEIDIMGAMNYSEALEKIYLYPSYSYGTAYTVIAVKEENLSIIENDYQTFDGIRIATYPGLEMRMPTLKQYAEIYGFSYELVYYDTYEETAEAVRAGEVDACIQMDLNIRNGLRSVARFMPRPYYFAVAPQRNDLLVELNNALGNLSQSYQHLQTELYNRYFKTAVGFRLSESNAAYVQSQKPLRVLFFDGNAPLQYVRDGEVCGVSKEFMDHFCKETGMQYRPVVAKNINEGIELIRQGKVDMVANVATSATLVSSGYLKLTMPYMEGNSVFLHHRDYDLGETSAQQNLSVNTEAKLKELCYIPNESAYLDSNIVTFYMRKTAIFKNLMVDWSDIRNIWYAVGLTEHADERLAGILNNYINSLQEDLVYEMLYRNLHRSVDYTFEELLYTYRYQIVLAAFVLLGLFSLFLQRRLYMERKRSMKESARFMEMAKLFNECLFEYSYNRDELAIQNNPIIFHGASRVEHFSRPEKHRMSEETKKYYDQFLQIFTEQIPVREIQLSWEKGFGWFRVQTIFINGSDPYALGRMIDITAEHVQQKKLEEKAHFDQLTGLANRYLIESAMERHFSSHKDTGVFLLMDLDNFKQVNDLYGHMEGDELLRNFAQKMEAYFRKEDLKGRIGGDEFVVFIAESLEESDLCKKLQEFLRILNEVLFSQYKLCKVSVSVGVIYFDEQIRSYQDAYRKADKAMYEAKAIGKNTFFIDK